MSIFLRALNALLMILLPVALGVFLARKANQPWKLFGIGALTFIASQVVHLPVLYGLTALFKAKILPSPPVEGSLIFNAVILGLLAGLCEEIARYLTYRFFLKGSRTWNNALMFGAGHGGVEAIILGLLVGVTLVQMIILRNTGLDSLNLPADQLALAQKQIADYWAAPDYTALLGALERLFAIITHLALTVIVLQTFTRNNVVYLILAIVWHAIIDGVAVFAVGTVGPYWTEVIIAVFALVNLFLIFVFRLGDAASPAPSST
jgi:uncharacterized membrane protein YhfC